VVEGDRKAPSECEVWGCENLPVFEFVGLVVNEDGTDGEQRPSYLCISCACGLMEGGPNAQVKLDVEGGPIILSRRET